MPEDCLTKRCFECDSHAIVGGKLDCNYMNRLGLAQPTVKNFLSDLPQEKTAEDLDKEMRQMEEQQQLVTERIAELKKKKEETGGTTSANLS